MTKSPERPEPSRSAEPEQPLTGPSAYSFRPSLIGSWFLFLGALLGPAIIIMERDPQGRVGLWIGLTILMMGLIIHRLGLSYHLEGPKLQVKSWWGFGRLETITLKDLAEASVHYSLTLRLVGLGHLFLSSHNPQEHGLTLLAQKRPQELADKLTALARAYQGDQSAPGPT